MLLFAVLKYIKVDKYTQACWALQHRITTGRTGRDEDRQRVQEDEMTTAAGSKELNETELDRSREIVCRTPPAST